MDLKLTKTIAYFEQDIATYPIFRCIGQYGNQGQNRILTGLFSHKFHWPSQSFDCKCIEIRCPNQNQKDRNFARNRGRFFREFSIWRGALWLNLRLWSLLRRFRWCFRGQICWFLRFCCVGKLKNRRNLRKCPKQRVFPPEKLVTYLNIGALFPSQIVNKKWRQNLNYS